jgi:RND superfamily putative drug exporter
MLQRIIRYVTRHPKRVIAVWAVAAIGLAVVGTSQAYRVTTDDLSEFLPDGSQSALATRYAQEAFGQEKGTHTVTALVERADSGRLTAADRSAVMELSERLAAWRPDTRGLDGGAVGDLDARAGRIVGTRVGTVSRDERFGLIGLQWKANTTDPIAQEAFRQFRDDAARAARAEDLRVGFTGGVASMADYMRSTEGTRSLSQALLFGSILLLTLLFFRGPLAAVVPILAIALVAAGAGGLVVLAALALDFELGTNTPQLITVVLVGIGVDYFLFLLFRFRERLHAGEDRRTAAASAASRVSPVIASAALAVVAAFATMAIAQFGQFRILGPAVAISVLVMLLAGVTLMPAIAALAGRALFWPSRSWSRERTGGPADRLGRRIARSPGRAALPVVAALVALSTFAAGTQMSYDADESGPTTSATRTADRIATDLSKGARDPQQIYVKSAAGALSPERLRPLRDGLAAIDGVTSVSAPTLTTDRRGAQIDLALAADPYTRASMDLVRGPIRQVARKLAPAGSTAMVGGTSAVYADVSDAVESDMALIFPIAAGLILLILVVSLRSLVAPLYLLGAVALEFTATLGASVLVVQELGGQNGVAFTLPLVLFLFVVALGTDYNLLMTARLREEMSAGKPVRQAVADAVRYVAPAIGAAGLVLASSFGTLMLEASETSRETGFAMAFGILLAALVVSSVLVPAATAIAGRRAWWPSHATRGARGPRAVAGQQPAPEHTPELA